MEFLVRMKVAFPGEMPESDRAELRKREAERASELASVGVLVRLWRVPGESANWGIWAAADATALHESLTSLPMFPYISAKVYPLARHPNDPLPGEPADGAATSGS
ncbi:muconolactone D-isomerase [Cryobacterium mesophilum]|uniref:muconolactone Delta-isomerase n=1 Tax=Terrimesophilobacter mesophilus TaxID=433647 RepID=A0A4R8VB37_9MICO|nr:muconolactone Delta-isomerase family protein [Terrimesophilobacter mesophilus]MBB5632761.1 muconolactone D-isomerase [Terrimesophilobacter mesophilus]TFB79556.1 muconolactone delta-isomerase [Terrimesophilobacter mesophilus]